MYLDVRVCVLLGSGGLLLCSGGVFFGVGQRHNNGVAFSLGSVPRTRWWANVAGETSQQPETQRKYVSVRTCLCVARQRLAVAMRRGLLCHNAIIVFSTTPTPREHVYRDVAGEHVCVFVSKQL
jgi:hypothetical protein